MTNLVFWLRLAISVGYILGPKDRKSVGKFFLWTVSRHLTSDLTLKVKSEVKMKVIFVFFVVCSTLTLIFKKFGRSR